MKLIEEIIELLSSPDGSLENALVKAQVLAHKLGERELAVWVKSELVGYEDPAAVPEYRVLPITVYGNVANIARRYTSYRLPTAGVPKDIKDSLLMRQIDSSIAVIRDWSSKKNLQAPLPPESYFLFQKGIDSSYAIESAWGVFSEGAFTQILVEVRSRLLDFMLQLVDKFPSEPQPERIKELSKEANVSEIFRGAVFGPGAVLNVAVGNNNTASQTTKQSIRMNDFSALADELRRHQVPETDINALEVAIKDDVSTEDHAPGNFGPKVRAWLGNMVAKSGTAAWGVTTQTAAGVLASALSKYYGFS